MRAAPMIVALLLLTPGDCLAAGPADLQPALLQQVERCWNPPKGAVGSVVVRMELRQDGRVVGVPVVNGLANAGVAAAAIHAVEFCQPYRLPPARFSDWQHIGIRLTAGAGQ